MPHLRHNDYLLRLLFGFGIGMVLAAHEASEVREERLFGSSSGSSVIVVYKKEHDKDARSGDRDRGGGHRSFRGDQQGPVDYREDEYYPQRNSGRGGGREADQEVRKEHGIKVYPPHNLDDQLVQHGRERDLVRDRFGRDDPHDARPPLRDLRGDRADVSRNGGSVVRAAGDSRSHRDERRDGRDRRHRHGNLDFDDLPLAEVGTYRFVNSQLPQQTPRNPSPTDFLEPRPPCARELDVCSYSHDYPTEKVQTIVDRYYNQMYDLYHAMYKIPPHEVQWVENYTHSFNEEKQHGEFVCQSETSHMRIGWAKNYKGRWMAVVNTERFPQTTRVEKCSHREKPCGYLPPCFKTSCKQREMLFPLIAVNPLNPSQKPQVDLFPVPSGCVCYVSNIARDLHWSDEGRTSSSSRSKLPAFLRSE
ncbi:uncharacterized protein LOC111264228 [Varroa jacobsoni]|uniref:uncharacterized protein LOC111264228 n=1 Tax=Varroa jacobsoni TaxID=62625 RepID=UPI000BF3B80A|nr:uncharacterized protein LOC111264228 [Varroa jacobsoni]